MKVVFIKLGTDAVWEPGWMVDTASQISALRAQGYRTVITSSGAVEAGTRRIAKKRALSTKSVREMYTKQTLAGYGTMPLMNLWEQAFAPHNLIPIPLLVTHSNLTTAAESESIRNRLLEVLEQDDGIVVANENDLVSGLEIQYWSTGLGENDKLQVALVTLASTIPEIEISGVFFATHRGGYFTDDPHLNPDATLVREISWDEWRDKDLIVRFLTPSLSPTPQRLPNNMIAKVCAGLICAKMIRVPHVAIAAPQQLVSFMTDTPHFVGTRLVA